MSDTETYFNMRDALLYTAAPIAIIGGLNWLYTGAANLLNPETAVDPNDLLHKLGVLPSALINVIYLIVGLAAIGLAVYVFLRSSGAPDFLDEAFFPATLTVPASAPVNANAATKIKVTPYAKVVYWAAKPALESGSVYPTPNDAYGAYENAGVAIADAQGEAVLRFRLPGQYTVRGNTLPAHVHYRVARAPLKDAEGNDIDPKRAETHTWSAVRTLETFQSFAQAQ